MSHGPDLNLGSALDYVLDKIHVTFSNSKSMHVHFRMTEGKEAYKVDKRNHLV